MKTIIYLESLEKDITARITFTKDYSGIKKLKEELAGQLERLKNLELAQNEGNLRKEICQKLESEYNLLAAKVVYYWPYEVAGVTFLKSQYNTNAILIWGEFWEEINQAIEKAKIELERESYLTLGQLLTTPTLC